MNTVKFLNSTEEKDKDALDKLQELGIEWKYIQSLDVYILNYGMEETSEDSLKYHPIVRECRSLIVRKREEIYSIIASSFYRFFNWNEDEKESEEFKKRFDSGKPILATEKKDGSLITVCYFDGSLFDENPSNDSPSKEGWHIFTRRTNADETPFFNGSKDVTDTYGSRVRKYLDLSRLDPELTYVFELCTPFVHVTRYDKESLTLISVNRKGVEIDINKVDIGVPIPEMFEIDSERELQDRLNSKPDDFEGYVLSFRDSLNIVHRLKYKSQRYLNLSHSSLNQNPSYEKLFDVITKGEASEVSAVFPNLKSRLDEMLQAIDRICENVKAFCIENAKLSRKEFALKVPKCAYTKLYFEVFAGKIVVGELRKHVNVGMIRSEIEN